VAALIEIYSVPFVHHNEEMYCGHCGIDVKELLAQGKTVYRKKGPKVRYFCEACKEELFDGVKLHRPHYSTP